MLDTNKYFYRVLLGAINYISTCTRPDITFVVNQLAKYANAPREAHWEVLIGLLQYLHQSQNWGIKLGGGDGAHRIYLKQNKKVFAVADANHGTGIDDKKDTTGYVLMVCGGPVSWRSRVQPVNSTSTTESEFRALSDASRETLWLAKVVKEFGIPTRPILVLGDSKGAIDSIKSKEKTPNTKHIEIHHDFMRDRFQTSHLFYQHISGCDNPADVFTKALPKAAFFKCRSMLGMVCV
jgi:hypothetical protein